MEGNINILETEALSRGSDTDLWVFENYNQRIAIATILCLVFIVGSIGNTLVITAVVLSRELRSSTNWFVVNLGCSDLLTCLCLPFYAVAMLSRDGWPLPGWICVANAAMVMICMGASVMTLALIAFNRWYLLTNTRGLQKTNVTKSMTSQLRKKHAVVVLAFIICLLPFGVSVSGFLSDPGIPWTGLLLAVNSCVNPLIYAGIWREFRNVMLAIIRFRLKDIPEPITCVRRFV
ncbi:octopamine receptor 1-like [Strongylocentrotus purpuratus]|uniref:G-protein coupled receptors family 1 profile domain-containing protein n=1 Tax=Strongylocentrotus purpuratus TaxID=7668 RepID=A0A7M7PFH9_STRPU|nr:octopamine receptor 1-like [Strongylocentrotus purpuratus]